MQVVIASGVVIGQEGLKSADISLITNQGEVITSYS